MEIQRDSPVSGLFDLIVPKDDRVKFKSFLIGGEIKFSSRGK